MKFTKPSPLIGKRIEVKDGSFLDKKYTTQKKEKYENRSELGAIEEIVER